VLPLLLSLPLPLLLLLPQPLPQPLPLSLRTLRAFASLRMEQVVRSMSCSFLSVRLNRLRYLATLSVATSPTGPFFCCFLAFFATTSERILPLASPMRSESVAAIIRKTGPHSLGSVARCDISFSCATTSASTAVSAIIVTPGKSPRSRDISPMRSPLERFATSLPFFITETVPLRMKMAASVACTANERANESTT
jgi:hypothetical protein